MHQGELFIPVQEKGQFVAAPLFSENVEIFINGMTARTATPSDSLMILGTILLLTALILAKDRKVR